MKVATKVVAAAALLALVSAPATRAAEATAGLDLASAYVFRGVTFNDGFVAQPYLNVSGLPVDLGVWGNIDIDDYDGTLNDGAFSEIDVTASYALPIEGIASSIGYCEYTYPGGAEADREFNVIVGLDEVLAPKLGIYYGVDGALEEDLFASLSLSHSVEVGEGVSLGLGTSVGYSYPEEGEDGFSAYDVSASLAWSAITLGVKYIGQIDDDVLTDVSVDADGVRSLGYDVEVVGTLGVSHSF